jgi:hypothetical protein
MDLMTKFVIGDKISINSSDNVGTIVDICPDTKISEKHGIDTNWIWIEEKRNGRKRRYRIPESNLAAYEPVKIV